MMSQTQLKRLHKLLGLWEKEFDATSVGTTDMQPMYAEVVALIIRQIRREIE